jgi:hypothetical protein
MKAGLSPQKGHGFNPSVIFSPIPLMLSVGSFERITSNPLLRFMVSLHRFLSDEVAIAQSKSKAFLSNFYNIFNTLYFLRGCEIV